MTAPQVVTVHPVETPVTGFVQAAIDQSLGKLTVVFAPGLHRAAGLRLRSDVTLHFEPGAELHFTPDYAAYAATPVAVAAEDSDRAMLIATGAARIAITGAGRIFCDGSRAFSTGEDVAMGTLIPARLRPRVLVFDRCRDVTVAGLTVDDSPMWTLHFVDCDGLNLTGLTISNNRRMPNTDGVVIDGCRDVRVTGCDIRTADDGIVLKTSARAGGGTTGPCENVRISDCHVESQSCAIKLGTESFSDFRNISFSAIRIAQSNRGIGLFSRDGGAFENVRFSDITLDCHETPSGYWGSGEPITINTLDRRPEDGPAGAIRGVVIENIQGTAAGAINLVAARAGGIADVTLSRITLTQQPGPLGTALCYDLRPTLEDRFAASDGAGRINAWRIGEDGKVVGLIAYPGGMPGIYLRGVTGLAMDAVQIDRPQPLPASFHPQMIVTDAL